MEQRVRPTICRGVYLHGMLLACLQKASLFGVSVVRIAYLQLLLFDWLFGLVSFTYSYKRPIRLSADAGTWSGSNLDLIAPEKSANKNMKCLILWLIGNVWFLLTCFAGHFSSPHFVYVKIPPPLEQNRQKVLRGELVDLELCYLQNEGKTIFYKKLIRFCKLVK